MYHYANTLGVILMIDPRLGDVTTFLSDTVGNSIKLNVEDFNCDKMVDRAV